MKRLPHNHRDRTLRILASKGGIITLRELRRLMEIKLENLDRILRGLEAQGRIVRTTGKLGMENISLKR
jgi:DNA-binding MarR family transcriptional regulator